MNRTRRNRIILGILLILAGAWMLIQQYYPEVRIWEDFSFTWPWYVIGSGGFLLLFGLLVDAPGLAVPAVILIGIGAILHYQNETGNWASWKFLWTLIPGFVGGGILLMGLLGGNLRTLLRSAGLLLLTSMVLFAIFGTLLGGTGELSKYWPVLLILFGVWIIIQPLLEKGGRR